MENEYKCQCDMYAPLVERYKNKNLIFYDFHNSVKTMVCDLGDASIIGNSSRTENLVRINIKSILLAMKLNDLKTIEFYVLHELRHVYQHEVIDDYKNGVKDLREPESTIKDWILRRKYIKALDENNKEDQNYYYQPTEIDAFAYSYAIMKYRYNYSKKDLNVFEKYGEDFDKMVESFVNSFKSRGL